MKEFVEKLIGRLKEKVAEYDVRIQRRNGDCYYDESQNQRKLDERARGIELAIGIVNELAEEYEREHIVDLCNQICNKADSIIKKDNNGWIPCNERLPEESGEYLTYVDYADETFIAIDEIDCDGLIKEWNCTPNYHVIAWQPLPKPYKKLTT